MGKLKRCGSPRHGVVGWLGEVMITRAVEESRFRGCARVQLTTDRSRSDAHRFYDRLGFDASHIGYRLILSWTDVRFWRAVKLC